jgi:hypothetical protein
MLPVRLSERLALAPSVTVELGRASRIGGSWYGGAGGPGVGLDLLGWVHVKHRSRKVAGAPFGCFGGMIGADCPSYCLVEDGVRHGIGVRVSAEYDIRFGGPGWRKLSERILWVMVGATRAISAREKECCHYQFGRPPWGNACGPHLPVWRGGAGDLFRTPPDPITPD